MAYDPITGVEVEGATAPPPADAAYDPAAGDIDRMLDEATRGSPYVGSVGAAPEAPILQPPPAPQPGAPTSALAGAEPSRVAPFTPGASDTPYVVPGGSRVEPFRPIHRPPIPVPSVEDRLRQMYPPPPPIPEGAEPGPTPGSYYVDPQGLGRRREQPQEPSGVVGSVGKALARGTAGIVDTFAPLAIDALLLTPGLLPAYSLSQAGTISPEFSKTVDAVRDKVRSTISDNVEWVQQKFPLTVPELTKAGSAGEVFTGTLERVVEGIPGLAGFLATTAVTGPVAAPIIWGAAGMAHGAERAARESNNDPAATAIGAAAEGFANGFPYHLLTTQAGKGILKGAITFGLTNAGIAAGTQVLDPKTIAAAQSIHDFIDQQDGRKIIEAGLTGFVQGATFGAAAGAFGGKKTTDTVLPGTPDPAAEAALRQSLDQGQPPPPSAEAAAGGPGAPSPAPSAGAPGAALAEAPGALPGLPAPAAERGLVAPPVPAPVPGARPVRTPGDIARQNADVERARQEQAGVEGIPGATTGPVLDANAPVPPRPGPGGLPVGPEPRPAVTPAREPPPEPVAPVPPGPGGAPIGPEPTPAPAVPPGPRPPGVVPGARQPELPGTSPVQPEPRRPPPVSPYRAEPGELPMDTGLPARPPGVAPEARQGELPVIPGAPPQGELPLRQPPSVGEPVRLPEEGARLPLGDQQTIPMKLKMRETWRLEPDDQTPGQWTLKSGNDVLAVGSSPEEARAIAEQRAARTPEPAAPLPTVGTEVPATTAAAPAPAPATATPGRGRRAAAERTETAVTEKTAPAAAKVREELLAKAETPGMVAVREGKTVGQVLKEQEAAGKREPARRGRAAKAATEETTPKETVAAAPFEYNRHLTNPNEQAANRAAVDALNGKITHQEALDKIAELRRSGEISEGAANVQLNRLDVTQGEIEAAFAGRGTPKTPKETVAEAKAKGEPVGPALMTREQVRKTLGLSTKKEVIPEKARAAVGEPTDRPTAAERAEAPPPPPAPRVSRMAREARAEAERMGQQGRSRDIPPEEGAPGYKPTTDYQKEIYPRAVREVLNRVKSVADIVRELAPKNRRGRPRTSGFPEFIENELATARDPELRARLEAEYAAQTTAEGRREVTDKIQYYQELHENEVHLREQISEARDNPDMSRVEQAREAAQRRVEELRRQARDINKIPEPADRNVRNRMKEPEAEKPLQDILDRANARHAAGEDGSIPVHDMLDAIANNTALGRLGLNQARTLAGILKRVLPKGTRVLTDEMAERFGTPSAQSEGAGGYYDRVKDTIVMRSEHGKYSGLSHTEVLLHEAIHAATSHYIDTLLRPGKHTPEQQRHLRALTAIRREIERIVGEREDSYDPTDSRRMEFSESLIYAAKYNFQELPTTIMTDPVVQQALLRSQPSREFVNEMRLLGYGEKTGMFAGMREKINAWTAFKAFVKNVFRIPASADSVFNHAMRALEDVVEAGARYRRQPEILRNIKDARLRDGAAPMYEAFNAIRAMPSSEELLQRARSAAMDKAERAGSALGETSRRALLNGFNVDAMVERYKHLFEQAHADPLTGSTNAFLSHRAATEKQAATTHRVHRELREEQENIMAAVTQLEKMNYDGKPNYLGDFSNRVGYLDAKMGSADPVANAHLTSAEDLRALGDLQAEWNRMPQEFKNAYKARQALYEKMHTAERMADLDAMMRYAVPNSTEAERLAARSQFMSRAGLAEFFADPDASPLARAMGEKYVRSRALVKRIADFQELGRVNGDYFPLRRHGDYIVSWGDPEGAKGEYGVQMFESRHDAELARAKLQAEGLDPNPVHNKATREGRGKIAPALMKQLEDELIQQGFSTAKAGDVRDVFSSIYLKRATEAQARRMGARRKGVLGASEDVRRVDSEEFRAHEHRMGYLSSAVERQQSLDQMQVHADYLKRNATSSEAIAAQDVINQMQKRMPSLDEHTAKYNGLGKMATDFGFLASLFRPARIPIELAGMHAMNQALLGGKHGQAAAARATLEAQRLAGFGAALRGGWQNMVAQMGGNLKAVNWENGALLRDRMIKNGASAKLVNPLYDRLTETNMIDLSHARVAAEMARPSSAWNRLASIHDRVIGGMAQLDHAVETMGRMVSAHAAATLELAKNGGNVTDAVNAAVDHMRAVTPNWNPYNAPWIASTQGAGGIGGFIKPILFQFRNYGLHSYAVYANLIREAYRGGSEGQRAQALKSLGGIVAYHALLGGVGIPIVGETAEGLAGLYDWMTGAKAPHSIGRAMRSYTADIAGPTVATALAQGLPTLAGIDVSSSLGLNNVLMLPEFRDLSPREMTKTIANTMFGVAGADVTSVAEGLYQAARGNTNGLYKIIPIRMARDLATAYDWETNGVRDSHGRVILPSSQLSTGDVILKALGGNPSRVQNYYEGRRSVNDYLSEERDERSKIIDTAVRDGLSAVGRMVTTYNHDYPQDQLTYDVLLKAIRDHQQAIAAPGTYGLRVPRKSLQGVREATRYLGQ